MSAPTISSNEPPAILTKHIEECSTCRKEYESLTSSQSYERLFKIVSVRERMHTLHNQMNGGPGKSRFYQVQLKRLRIMLSDAEKASASLSEKELSICLSLSRHVLPLNPNNQSNEVHGVVQEKHSQNKGNVS